MREMKEKFDASIQSALLGNVSKCSSHVNWWWSADRLNEGGCCWLDMFNSCVEGIKQIG